VGHGHSIHLTAVCVGRVLLVDLVLDGQGSLEAVTGAARNEGRRGSGGAGRHRALDVDGGP
jgi:hypothetical protein